MLRPLKYGLFFAVLLALTGCAGKNYSVRPMEKSIHLGETTYSEVTRQMWVPHRTGDLLKNGKTVKTITYVYSYSGDGPLEADVIPARTLSYYFHNEILVGREFISSFKSDNSNFDETKVDSIIKGKTTRAEVIQLFGRPSARFIYPMVKETYGEAFGYTYQRASGGVFSGIKVFTKTLKITFDDKGVVLDVDYSSFGNK